MAKCSGDLKNNVKGYLVGSLGYPQLIEKYGFLSHSLIERWILAYPAFGKGELRKKQETQMDCVQF